MGELTAFQLRCYALVRTIPEGKVATYGAVAEALGSCARAVGGCMCVPTIPRFPVPLAGCCSDQIRALKSDADAPPWLRRRNNQRSPSSGCADPVP